MSNYVVGSSRETVSTAQPNNNDGEEQRCNRCRGTGVVEVQDQETDCIFCEGYGYILVPVVKTTTNYLANLPTN
jgi:RecJ-like exonuclease